MKKLSLFLLFIIAALQLNAQSSYLEPSNYFLPKPGDEVYPKRIITSQTGSDGNLYALVELGQNISPQAVNNGPSGKKYDAISGELFCVGLVGLEGSPYGTYMYTSNSTYIPGYQASFLTNYRSGFTYDATVWLPAQKNGDYITVSHHLKIYRYITYRYKTGFLGLVSKYASYPVKYVSYINITQKI